MNTEWMRRMTAARGWILVVALVTAAVVWLIRR